MKKIRIWVLVWILGLAIASTVSAAEFIKPSGNNETVTLPASETHRNVYIVGANVISNSPISGDFYGAGGIIKVSGPVEDDLVLAGGNVDISGRVGGSARIAAGNITIIAPVQEDLLIGGGNVFIADSAPISGDLVVGVGNLELNAPVSGNVRIAGGDIVINSNITGEVWVTADEKLVFGPNSVVLGKINYYGDSDPIIQEGAQVGIIERHPLPRHDFFFSKSLFAAGFIVMLLAWFLTALLLMYLFNPKLIEVTDLMRNEPLANLGIGLGVLVVGPIIFILLLLSIVGYYIAMLVLAWYILAFMLSGIIGAVFLGRWIYSYIDRNAYGIDWRVVLSGVLIYRLAALIPIVGWIITAVLCLTAFGAIMRMAKHQIRR